MAEAVLMPRQGQSVETCIITQWLKQKGDHVDEGEILFSYETDKAAFDEPAPKSGVLLDVLFEEGDEVPVLETVAFIGEKGEELTIDAPKVATESIISEEAPVNKEKIIQKQEETTEKDKKIRISPRARKLAESKSINLSGISGSGPNGRIIVADIEKTASTITPSVSPDTRISHPPVQSTVQQSSGDYTDAPLSNIRKIISTNMMLSLSSTAQLTHHTSADARNILSLRKAIKEGSETRFPATTTLNDMVCYAIVKSLITLPEINAHFLDDKIRTFKPVHLGIAVDTPRGLMVPVLRNAERLNLGGLGQSLKEVAESCKNGSIDPDLLSPESGTFTVSNLGAFGVELFTPVLNIPQCGIMGINTIIQRPADTGDGTIGFIPHIGLSLTYNHRALDGAPASRFLQEVSNNIANFNSII